LVVVVAQRAGLIPIAAFAREEGCHALLNVCLSEDLGDETDVWLAGARRGWIPYTLASYRRPASFFRGRLAQARLESGDKFFDVRLDGLRGPFPLPPVVGCMSSR
jgi:hypothetical protein